MAITHKPHCKLLDEELVADGILAVQPSPFAWGLGRRSRCLSTEQLIFQRWRDCDRRRRRQRQTDKARKAVAVLDLGQAVSAVELAVPKQHQHNSNTFHFNK